MKVGKDGLQYNCRDCQSAARRAYYAANRERFAAYQKKWVSANREQFDAYQAAYELANPDKGRARRRKYALANPGRGAVMQGLYRAVEAGAPIGLVPNDIKALLIEVYGPACMKPGCSGVDLTLDHIIPLSKGGAHAVFNLQLLCMSCNARKGNRSSVDYRPVIGRERCAS